MCSMSQTINIFKLWNCMEFPPFFCNYRTNFTPCLRCFGWSRGSLVPRVLGSGVSLQANLGSSCICAAFHYFSMKGLLCGSCTAKLGMKLFTCSFVFFQGRHRTFCCLRYRMILQASKAPCTYSLDIVLLLCQSSNPLAPVYLTCLI